VTADLTHLAGRVPDGQGHPGEADRRHAADVAGQDHQLAAQVYVTLLAGGDEGGAIRHLARLKRDPDIDPWRLCAAVAARALEASGSSSGR
jgi:hypothetical protein